MINPRAATTMAIEFLSLLSIFSSLFFVWVLLAPLDPISLAR